MQLGCRLEADAWRRGAVAQLATMQHKSGQLNASSFRDERKCILLLWMHGRQNGAATSVQFTFANEFSFSPWNKMFLSFGKVRDLIEAFLLHNHHP